MPPQPYPTLNMKYSEGGAQDAPYLLEALAGDFGGEAVRVRLALLTAAARLFFKRPPECQRVLGAVLAAAAADGNQDVHDRRLLYYRRAARPAAASAAVWPVCRRHAALCVGAHLRMQRKLCLAVCQTWRGARVSQAQHVKALWPGSQQRSPVHSPLTHQLACMRRTCRMSRRAGHPFQASWCSATSRRTAADLAQARPMAAGPACAR